MKKYILTAITFLILFSGCEQETKKAIPPNFVVNRVTDMYAMKDGSHFIFLSSNMNREYDYGRLLVVEIKDDGTTDFKDSILVPSIAGKMSVNEDETEVYVTSRDMQGVTRYRMIKTDSGYKFDFIDPTDGYTSKVLKTEKEPNAVNITPDGKRLFVTHIMSGGLAVIDLKEWEKTDTYSLRKGVTALIYDENSGYFVASHRESGTLSIIDTIETISRLIIDVAETTFGMPHDGYDVRSLQKSPDGLSIYASFRNSSRSTTADTAPQLVNFAVTNDGGVKTDVLFTVPLRGRIGEIAVMPYSNGEGEDEVKGDIIFIASDNERTVFIVDSIQKKVIDEIVYDKTCSPYQLHFSSSEKNKGTLFVSCFINDRIKMYDIDVSTPRLYELKGEIR